GARRPPAARRSGARRASLPPRPSRTSVAEHLLVRDHFAVVATSVHVICLVHAVRPDRGLALCTGQRRGPGPSLRRAHRAGQCPGRIRAAVLQEGATTRSGARASQLTSRTAARLRKPHSGMTPFAPRAMSRRSEHLLYLPMTNRILSAPSID